MPCVMIVDDSASERTALARLLRNEGHHLILAESGDEAFRKMERTPPDLIVLDVQMPGMDGLQVLEMLQVDSRWKNVPVVMLTGVSDTLAIQRAHQLGAREYMVKAAFSVRQLLDTVRKYITAKTPGAGAESAS